MGHFASILFKTTGWSANLAVLVDPLRCMRLMKMANKGNRLLLNLGLSLPNIDNQQFSAETFGVRPHDRVT